MKRNILLVGIFILSTFLTSAQIRTIGNDVIHFGKDPSDENKEQTNQRRGSAPAFLTPLTLNASTPFIIPENGSGYVQSKDVTAFNRQYAGKVVFSKSYIPRDARSAANFTNSFTFGDNIESRFYFETNLFNYYLYVPWKGVPVKNSKGYFTTLVYIDGDTMNSVYTGDKIPDKEIRNTNNIRVPIYSPGAQKKFNDLYLIDVLNNLSVGTHKIRIDVWAGDITDSDSPRSLKPVCTGEFTIIRSEGQKDYSKGKTLKDVEAGMSDPEIEAAAIEALNAEFRNNTKVKAEFTDVVIISRDWRIVRDEVTGAVLRRQMDFYGKGVQPDGICLGHGCTIYQQYQGNGYSNVCNYLMGNGQPEELDCND